MIDFDISEDSEDTSIDFFCKSSGLRAALEEYVRDLYLNLYIFPDKYFRKSVTDIYEDLQDILERN